MTAMAAFLASDAVSYITAEAIDIFGDPITY